MRQDISFHESIRVTPSVHAVSGSALASHVDWLLPPSLSAGSVKTVRAPLPHQSLVKKK